VNQFPVSTLALVPSVASGEGVEAGVLSVVWRLDMPPVKGLRRAQRAVETGCLPWIAIIDADAGPHLVNFATIGNDILLIDVLLPGYYSLQRCTTNLGFVNLLLGANPYSPHRYKKIT
jgi:hypothetical protein